RHDFLHRHERALLSLSQARANRLSVDWTTAPLDRPAYLGTRAMPQLPLATLVEYIDWTPFFHVWGLRGRYPDLLDSPAAGVEARAWCADAQELLADLIANERLEARGVIGFFPANSVDDDIHVYSDEQRSSTRALLCTLRQQTAKENGGPNLALADFV